MVEVDRLGAELLTLAIENEELRLQLAEGQDQCVELAVDAGSLHATIEELRTRLADAERDRDAWRAEADRLAAELEPERRSPAINCARLLNPPASVNHNPRGKT